MCVCDSLYDNNSAANSTQNKSSNSNPSTPFYLHYGSFDVLYNNEIVHGNFVVVADGHKSLLRAVILPDEHPGFLSTLFG